MDMVPKLQLPQQLATCIVSLVWFNTKVVLLSTTTTKLTKNLLSIFNSRTLSQSTTWNLLMLIKQLTKEFWIVTGQEFSRRTSAWKDQAWHGNATWTPLWNKLRNLNQILLLGLATVEVCGQEEPLLYSQKTPAGSFCQQTHCVSTTCSQISKAISHQEALTPTQLNLRVQKPTGCITIPKVTHGSFHRGCTDGWNGKTESICPSPTGPK